MRRSLIWLVAVTGVCLLGLLFAVAVELSVDHARACHQRVVYRTRFCAGVDPYPPQPFTTPTGRTS